MNWIGRKWFAGIVFATLLCAVPWSAFSQQSAPAQEKSVKPGINDRWRSPDIQPLVETLETESREIYHEREALARLVDAKPGMAVADLGAGSGFMTLLFAKMVGAKGRVYAVDINPKMLERVSQLAAKEGLKNIQTVLDNDTSTELAANSVDIIFLCDTYHHFEYPKAVLASMHKALRPGGQVVLVEFHLVQGKSPSWMFEHVRAGQEVFTREFVDAGFAFDKVLESPLFTENYILRFRKAEARR
ncbi:MAG: methyltransferase domain-containing protein [Acidobacteria bacterium]|nr:methyltransferase domain-containing protein [Acidobacteriota bacterium]MCL5286576.1 methyltransferase domain-containing protein [Acidobacteriota bacterium]